VKSSGCKHVVLGLSGGIDSAVAAILCTEALGEKNVLCVFMPDETTPEDDIKHYQKLVKDFHLQSRQIDISPILRQIQTICIEKPDKVALANIKARIRMTLLYEYANKTNALVCGTSNKSEILIGYFTKYGDGGVDFQALGDVYKTQIYQIAESLNLPKNLIKKSPTAGLWKGQTDEKELGMTYETLDKILFGLELKLEGKEIQKFAQVKKSEVERIRQMRIKSQHKRRTPLIPKIGLRTPGLDWRAPVQEG
jgi:NAD+ synthase